MTGSRESALGDADGDERGAFSARNKFMAAPIEMRREEETTNEMTTYAERGGGRTRQPEAEI